MDLFTAGTLARTSSRDSHSQELSHVLARDLLTAAGTIG